MSTNKDYIIERIQNYLYSFYAKDIETARNNEIYDCLCRYIMEVIGKRWVDTKKIKTGYEVYILSFEYLPGKFLPNIIYRLGIEKDIRQALEEIGFDYDTIIAHDPDPDLGIGDMGIGSSYLINAFTNNKIKATAYALRYESGNFRQIIENGMQKASSTSWIGNGSNFEHRKGFTNIIEIYDNEHRTITYDMPVVSEDASFVNTLRLFKSESTENLNISDFSKGDIINAYENHINNSSITEFLYVDDSTYEGKILRLKQEYFFSASAIRDFVRRYLLYYEDIEKIKEQTNVIINDIHPTLALIEFIRLLTTEHGFSIKKAIDYSREIFYHIVFSITDDSLERYPIDEIRKMNEDIFKTIIEIQNELSSESDFIPFVVDGNVVFKHINLALSKEYIFLSKMLAEDRFTYSDKIVNINLGTDRISYAKSANPNLFNCLNNYDIKSLRKDYEKLNKLKNNTGFLNELENIKYKNKVRLVDYLGEGINPYSIFDMQLSIMHESKRQILNAISIAYEYYYLRDNSNAYFVPKTYIFSGKANEGYFMAKEAIKFILALKKLIDSDKHISEKLKIIFVEDLGSEDLKYLYPSVDIYSNLTLPTLDNQNFDILNSIYNMSNILSARGGIVDNLDRNHSFFLMGDEYKKIKQHKSNNDYKVSNFIYQNEIVKYTLDNLLNESSDLLTYNFRTIYDQLLLYNDSFFTLYDLESLIDIRNKISRDYTKLQTWVGREIDNIIWARSFNFDQIRKRKKVW